MFVAPITTTSFQNYHARNNAANIECVTGEPAEPVLLDWILLNATTFATLLGTVITVYLGANVAQKALTKEHFDKGGPDDPPGGDLI